LLENAHVGESEWRLDIQFSQSTRGQLMQLAHCKLMSGNATTKSQCPDGAQSGNK